MSYMIILTEVQDKLPFPVLTNKQISSIPNRVGTNQELHIV